MNTIEEKVVNKDNFNLHCIQTKKYKTMNIVAKLKAPLERETITKRALLPYILQQGTKSYPSRQALQLKLDELYGAVLSVDGSKKGENHIISVRFELANQKFISQESSIIEEGIDLFSELLFQPNVSGEAFDESLFNREKETLKQKMSALQDDKMSYANTRLIDEMCKNEAYQLHVHGYEEDLEAITAKDLYDYFQKMLHEDQLDIYVLGDFNETEISEKLTSVIKREAQHGKTKQTTLVHKKVDNPKEIIEKQAIQQAKLHLGYRTNTTYHDEDYFALQVFNGLFGAFPSSKLFINVREKNSLAYYAASRFESHKGLLLIFSGIAPEDYEKALRIIREQMTAMKQGDFTEVALKETKDLIVNQLLETLDNPQGIIELLYQQIVADKNMTPEQLIAGIQQVTLSDVKDVAGKLEEDTVYLLTSEGGAAQ